MASEYLKWKYRDVQPDAPVQHTKKELAANWWRYHWKALLLGAALLSAPRHCKWAGKNSENSKCPTFK